MLGVVREIPPQLILPDNILPDKAKASAVAHWMVFSCQALVGMLSVVTRWLEHLTYVLVLFSVFPCPIRFGSSVVVGSTIYSTPLSIEMKRSLVPLLRIWYVVHCAHYWSSHVLHRIACCSVFALEAYSIFLKSFLDVLLKLWPNYQLSPIKVMEDLLLTCH
jgi:hypothetical protein